MSKKVNDDIDGAIQFLMNDHADATLCVRMAPAFSFLGVIHYDAAMIARNEITTKLREYMGSRSLNKFPRSNSLCPEFFDAVIDGVGCYEMNTSQCLFDGGEKRVYRPDNGTFFWFPSV